MRLKQEYLPWKIALVIGILLGAAIKDFNESKVSLKPYVEVPAAHKVSDCEDQEGRVAL